MNAPNTRVRIALTLGDPAGVGPELCLRALSEPAIVGECVPMVFGDVRVLLRCAEHLGWEPPRRVLTQAEFLAGAACDEPCVVDHPALDARSVQPGVCNATTGKASFLFIQSAIDAVLAGRVAAVTTGPINKEALHAAGLNYPGHTEMFAERTAAVRSCMMQFSAEITCTFVTTHVGYAEVPGLLTERRILDVIELTDQALRRIHRRPPRIVVCGLNPHAGEHGLFGNGEEQRIIEPAIRAAQDQGLLVDGPLPPDTAFLPVRRRQTDGFVCMYHDQGHIPVKALAFESAVNTTLGLPIIRTSVDHGTAGDIAWQGVADPGSLLSALRLATRLAQTVDAGEGDR